MISLKDMDALELHQGEVQAYSAQIECLAELLAWLKAGANGQCGDLSVCIPVIEGEITRLQGLEGWQESEADALSYPNQL